MKIHVVKSGESLRDIARRYSVDVPGLIRLNQLAEPSRLSAGQSLVIPDDSPSVSGSIEVCAFVCPPMSVDVLRESLPYFTYISPYTHSFSSEGELVALHGHELISIAREQGCAPLLCLANLGEEGGFSSGLAHGLFMDKEMQERLLGAVLSRLREEGYYGLHLAFNYLFPFDRDNYSRFVADAAELLHRQGFMLSVELAPMEGAGLGSALCAGQDYAALGRTADRLSLMSCRWGHALSAPQPLAPIARLRRALDYAVSLVPSEKLLMGLSGSGFDWRLPWRQGMAARQLSNAAAAELAVSVGAELSYDPAAQAPFFNYSDALGRRHSVWFEDGRSLRAKLRLVEEYSLAGLSLYTAEKLCRPALYTLESMYSVDMLL